jgi:hypothetical protein
VQCVAATMAFAGKESKHYQCEHVLLQSYGFGGDEPRFDSAVDALARQDALFFSEIPFSFGSAQFPTYLFHQPVMGPLHGIILRRAPRISNLSDAIVTLLVSTVCLGVATLS